MKCAHYVILLHEFLEREWWHKIGLRGPGYHVVGLVGSVRVYDFKKRKSDTKIDHKKKEKSLRSELEKIQLSSVYIH